MAVKLKIDFDWGDTAYMKDDPEQTPMSFVGFIGRPGNIKYILDNQGCEYEVYDFLVSKEPDELKKFLNQNKDDADE